MSAAKSVTQHFVFALVEDFTHLAFACAVEPLRIANLVSGRPLYRWSLASANGKTATASNGIVNQVQYGFDALPTCDRVFVISGLNVRKQDHRQLIAALRRAKSAGIGIGALCSGSLVLAQAGLLDGCKAAIHWEYHDSFAEDFPQVTLVRGVFVADEKILTASGGSATADLMLHLIERDHGYDLSIAVADQMVYNAVRESTASQRISFQARNGVRNRHLARAIAIMQRRLDEPMQTSEIAAELGISTRQLERLFATHLNISPRRYQVEMRLDRARRLLVQTEMNVTEVALACGFGNFSHFSRSFRNAYGIPPSSQRAHLS